MAPCSRLMSLTEAEFLRLIPRAVSAFEFSINSNVIVVRMGEGRVRIAFQARPERRIASLSLPVLQVDIAFENLDKATEAEFIAGFDRTFHRGGG